MLDEYAAACMPHAVSGRDFGLPLRAIIKSTAQHQVIHLATHR